MTAWAALLFGLSQVSPAVLVYPWRSILVKSVIAYVKREPVRVFAWAVVAAVVVVSILTGVPVAAIAAQVVAYAAVAEKVRASVTPVIGGLVSHEDPPAA